jgi:pimeloyl-ACP methyl ester carboxylesterase
MKTWSKRLLIAAGVIAGLWILTGLGLAATNPPKFAGQAIALPSVQRHGCAPSPSSLCFKARDGATLHAFVIPAAEGKPIVLMLHGVMSSAAELEPAAQALHAASGAGVVALDLRGHGFSDGRFGDIDYIGQCEDDVADVVAALRAQYPHTRLILSGHSMGGGVAMRYAAKSGVPPIDGYLLFAPHLGEKSPTTPHDESTAKGAESFVKLHLGRTVGLLMVNAVGITAFNGLGTLYFNVSDGHGLLYYSFRAMSSCAPDDYRTALSADTSHCLSWPAAATKLSLPHNTPSSLRCIRRAEP